MEQKIVNKKGQAGLITGLVFGVASLVIGVIIAFVLVSTLTGADLISKNGVTVTNESANTVGVTNAWLNATNYSLSTATAGNSSNSVFDVTAIWTLDPAYNTTYNVSLGTGYWTEYSTGIIVAKNATVFSNVSITYTYQTKSAEELAQDRLSANFTEGVDNVSGKIPTVLLVAAIVLILGILAVLVAVWQRMKLSGQGGTL